MQAALVSGASADVRITEDYVALVFEAEDSDTRGERWVFTDSSTAEQENDPDGNHSDDAVGGAYIELLPDMRVTHEDEFGPPTAIWNKPGTGPKAEYTMNFPEAGRYYVHLRGFSTGTEDNGIHIGINNTWPDSGARMQFCTAGRGWQWSGRQRDSGGQGACGAKKTIWVTVEEAGEHTFMISAREDGFEADRMMLIKDLSDNTRICSPSGVDDINCVNGSLENVDEVVDMAVSATLDQTEIELGSSVLVSIVVRNNDGYDTASDVMLKVAEGVGTLWEVTDLQEGCEIEETFISCELGTVIPSSPGEEGSHEFEFTLEPLQSGEFEITVAIETSSVDGSEDNDAANQGLTVIDLASTLSALSLDVIATDTTWQSNTESRVEVIASNGGPGDAIDVVLNISIPAGLSVSDRPAQCIGTSELQCEYQMIPFDEQVKAGFGLTPTAAGLYSVSVSASASNLNGEAPSDSIIVTVEDPETDDSGTDTGGGDTGTMTGGTTDSGEDDGGADGSETGGSTDGGTDGEIVTEPPAAKESSGGALVWWTLMLLAIVLCTRSNHLSRSGRM